MTHHIGVAEITDEMATAKLPTNFLSKIKFTDGCWLWTGAGGGQDGRYGTACVGKRKKVPAHRAVYETLVRAIPEGLVLDHLCKCTRCVNPNHLEPVTQAENVRRGTNRNRLKTLCPRGHEYTEENTVRYGANPGRQCLICHREKSRQRQTTYRARRAAGNVSL